MILDIVRLGREIYDVKNWREARRMWIFFVRACLYYSDVKALYFFFQEDAVLRDVFSTNKFPVEQLTRAFFYKGSTVRERHDLIRYHFSYLRKLMQPVWLRRLYDDRTELLLWQSHETDIDWRTMLVFYPGERKEGLFSLRMELNGSSNPIYQMMCWINQNKEAEPSLWIGAMQGPNQENAKEIVKEMTKRAYRYRTKNLILYITMALARALKVKHIYAVSNQGYYAMNHVRLNRKLKTNFGAFWEEVGGHVTADERFYELPLVETRKSVEEVPSRKRAVYRKRFAFQDEVDESVKNNMEKILIT